MMHHRYVETPALELMSFKTSTLSNRWESSANHAPMTPIATHGFAWRDPMVGSVVQHATRAAPPTGTAEKWRSPHRTKTQDSHACHHLPIFADHAPPMMTAKPPTSSGPRTSVFGRVTTDRFAASTATQKVAPSVMNASLPLAQKEERPRNAYQRMPPSVIAVIAGPPKLSSPNVRSQTTSDHAQDCECVLRAD